MNQTNSVSLPARRGRDRLDLGRLFGWDAQSGLLAWLMNQRMSPTKGDTRDKFSPMFCTKLNTKVVWEGWPCRIPAGYGLPKRR